MVVLWAAFFNFAAFFVFHTQVLNTVGKTVDSDVVSEAVIFAGLVGAIGWNFLTCGWGLPTSSSHALACTSPAQGSPRPASACSTAASLEKTILFIFPSPALGLALGFLLMLANMWLFRRATPAKVDGLFRRLQLVSAAAFSLGHGGNDAQKTMGIIEAPCWSAPATSSWSRTATCRSRCGSCSPPTRPSPRHPVGGWRIVKTLGQRITALKPVGGFSAETAAALALYLATFLGIPVSTTQTITGAIVGVGATRRLSAVRWGVAGRIVWAWVLTIPAAAVIAAVTYAITVSPCCDRRPHPRRSQGRRPRPPAAARPTPPEPALTPTGAAPAAGHDATSGDTRRVPRWGA